MSESLEAALEEEAAAFDQQIIERVENGHIPDLRLVERCEYFYNNPWRDPAYVDLDMGEQFRSINAALRSAFPGDAASIRVLEVGCGPGYLSLELAREGYSVTGIDLSTQCIDIAKRFADADPFVDERGSLDYVAGDFFAADALESGSFDAVVFLGALHHLPDQHRVAERVLSLLRPGGLVLIYEPARDLITGDAALVAVAVETLLSAAGGFYRDLEVPQSRAQLQELADRKYTAMIYETEDGEKLQSANDNEAGFAEIHEAFAPRFEITSLDKRYAFFHEMIGGLRFDDDTNSALATFIQLLDRELCERGVIDANEFFMIGRKAEA